MEDINLIELLRTHIGETFYSPICGDCILKEIEETDAGNLYLVVNTVNESVPGAGYQVLSFDKDGKVNPNGQMLLYPSLEMYELHPQTAWEKWKAAQKMTYTDVMYSLFEDHAHGLEETPTYPLLTTSDKQLEKIMALNKILNVCKYIEGYYVQNFKSTYGYIFQVYNDEITVEPVAENISPYYFSSSKNAHKALSILGEDVIKTALNTDW